MPSLLPMNSLVVTLEFLQTQKGQVAFMKVSGAIFLHHESTSNAYTAVGDEATQQEYDSASRHRQRATAEALGSPQNYKGSQSMVRISCR
jgi:hypothetical protein